MNTFVGLGRLTKDPEIRYKPGDNPLCIASYTIAIQDDNNTERADFINCKSFGKTAEILEKYCHKGELIGVEGKMASGSYTKDGKKIFYMEAVIHHITFTPKVRTEDSLVAKVPEGFDAINDSDIPF